MNWDYKSIIKMEDQRLTEDNALLYYLTNNNYQHLYEYFNQARNPTFKYGSVENKDVLDKKGAYPLVFSTSRSCEHKWKTTNINKPITGKYYITCEAGHDRFWHTVDITDSLFGRSVVHIPAEYADIEWISSDMFWDIYQTCLNPTSKHYALLRHMPFKYNANTKTLINAFNSIKK